MRALQAIPKMRKWPQSTERKGIGRQTQEIAQLSSVLFSPSAAPGHISTNWFPAKREDNNNPFQALWVANVGTFVLPK